MRALAQADVAVGQLGTGGEKPATWWTWFDPTKLIEIVEVGKRLLITRGSLTTFSIANDVAKRCDHSRRLATTYPQLAQLDVMRLASPIRRYCPPSYSTLIIVLLIPLSQGRQVPGAGPPCCGGIDLRIGGIIVPFAGIG